MHASADGLNFGAAYVTPDYHHVLPFVDKVQHNRMRDVYYWATHGGAEGDTPSEFLPDASDDF